MYDDVRLKNLKEKNVAKETAKRILMILLGSLIMAFSINAFIVPHKLISGGVTGVAIILQYLTEIDSGIFVLIFNMPLFLIGARYINKDFVVMSLIGMVSFSIFLMLTKSVSQMRVIDDLLASCIYGGVFNGIGSGLVFRNRASTGGTDIIGVILKKKKDLSISTVGFIINIFIVMMGALTLNYTIAMYTLINMFIFSRVFDLMLKGFNSTKMVLIISENADLIADNIMGSINRGVTFLHGEGAYTKKDKKIIYCIVSQKQIAELKKAVYSVDNAAFMSIVDAAEIKGNGFKSLEF